MRSLAGMKRTLLLVRLGALGLAAGMSVRGQQADDTVFLPSGNRVAEANGIIDDAFPDSAGLSAVSVLFRGDVTTVAGLDQIDRALAAAVAEPTVTARLVPGSAVSPASIVRSATGVSSIAALTQSQLDATIAKITADPTSRAAVVWARLVAPEPLAGSGLAVASLQLRAQGDDEALRDAELTVARVAPAVAGPLTARALSAATIDVEKQDASSSSMNVMLVLSLAVIALAMFVFFRSGSDLALSLGCLGLVVLGALGFEGWAGPDGLGLVGPPNQLTSMVPIMLISLCVDYAVQLVALYRERRVTLTAVPASAATVRGAAGPLVFAGSVTVISLLTNIASPIPANQDFGIVAAFGVVWGLIVFLTIRPACRAILDDRRERRGTLAAARPMADAVPGADALATAIGNAVGRRPGLFLGVVLTGTIGLGVAITGLETTFTSTDFLPRTGESIADLDALAAAFGGKEEVVNVLVEAELTDDRTLRNLFEIATAFDDPQTRPEGASSAVTRSLGTLFRDWADDSGEAGDRYDPELAGLTEGIDQGLTLDAAGVQRVLDRLKTVDPAGFAAVAVEDPNGVDRTLLQFSASTGDQDRTKRLVSTLEGLWLGPDREMTASSGEIITTEITDEITASSTQGFASSTVIALLILVLVYGVGSLRPALGFIAVLPIVLVLVWLLGIMALVGIPYNVVTSLIAALSMGIGIDYSIHVIHRFTELRAEHGDDLRLVVRDTMRTTGSAIIGSGLTTALGFAVLIFSPLTPFRQFGIVTTVTIALAVFASLVVVPPLLVVWAAYNGWRTGRLHAADPAATAEATATEAATV